MLDDKYKDLIVKIIEQHIRQTGLGIFLFGSRAEKLDRTFSDVDIGVMADKPIEKAELSLVKEDLENSNIPFKVDLVDFRNTNNEFKIIALEKIEIWKDSKVIQNLIANFKN